MNHPNVQMKETQTVIGNHFHSIHYLCFLLGSIPFNFETFYPGHDFRHSSNNNSETEAIVPGECLKGKIKFDPLNACYCLGGDR